MFSTFHRSDNKLDIVLSDFVYFKLLLFSSDFCNFNVISGIPGSAKSALCKELLNPPGGLGDDRPVHSLMGDLVKGILKCRILSKLFWPFNVAMHPHEIF